MTNLMTRCVALQGDLEESQITEQQRRTAQQAVKCVDWAQVQKEKDVNGRVANTSANPDFEEDGV